MALGSLLRNEPSPIEYGSDGGRTGGIYFTPWPGVVNDSQSVGYVDQEQAEGLPGVGAGVDLIATVLGQLQPLLFRDTHDPRTPITRLQTPPLLLNPDPLWHPLPSWLYSVCTAMAWHGNSFAYRGPEVSDYRGYPLRLPLIDPTKVSWDGTDYLLAGVGGATKIAPGDMLHVATGTRPGYRLGRGILDRYQETLRLLVVTERAQFVLMKSGKPMGILSLGVDVTPEEAGQYKQGFLQAVAESGVAALGNADFKGVQWNAQDLAMVPAREFNLRLASDITRVPPYLLGVPSESRVYSNAESEWANFIRVTLSRYLNPLEAALTGCYPRDQIVRFDIDELMRADSTARWNVYAIGSNIGALTVDEIRAAEHMPPLPEPIEGGPDGNPDGGDEPAEGDADGDGA